MNLLKPTTLYFIKFIHTEPNQTKSKPEGGKKLKGVKKTTTVVYPHPAWDTLKRWSNYQIQSSPSTVNVISTFYPNPTHLVLTEFSFSFPFSFSSLSYSNITLFSVTVHLCKSWMPLCIFPLSTLFNFLSFNSMSHHGMLMISFLSLYAVVFTSY